MFRKTEETDGQQATVPEEFLEDFDIDPFESSPGYGDMIAPF